MLKNSPKLQDYSIITMEDLELNESLRRAIPKLIRCSHVFFLLLGDEYGPEAPGRTVSWCEYEYEQARRWRRLLGDPTIKVSEAPETSPDERQVGFRQRVIGHTEVIKRLDGDIDDHLRSRLDAYVDGRLKTERFCTNLGVALLMIGALLPLLVGVLTLLIDNVPRTLALLAFVMTAPVPVTGFYMFMRGKPFWKAPPEVAK